MHDVQTPSQKQAMKKERPLSSQSRVSQSKKKTTPTSRKTVLQKVKLETISYPEATPNKQF